ncbi:MAG: hypothetical protein WBM50_20530 [Acidimicrobiales bacterium]
MGHTEMTINHVDPDRAGTSLVHFAVDDLDLAVAQLHRCGIDTDEIVTANKGVTLCSVADPDYNDTISFSARINNHEHWRDPTALQTFRGQGPDDEQMTMPRSIHVAEHQVAPQEQR